MGYGGWATAVTLRVHRTGDNVEDRLLTTAKPPTPEQVREAHELSLKLTGIFMPQALRQMKALYERVPGQTTGRLVHYTSAEAALQIIEKKQFWMRNTVCMTDYREVLHGYDIFNNYFADKTQGQASSTRLIPLRPALRPRR